jgi:uncharacterized protein (DUF362 family)
MATKNKRLSRRKFIRDGSRIGGGLILSPVILDLAGCSSEGKEAPGAGLVKGDGVLFGLYPSSDVANPVDALRMALADMDFSWLREGDTVLIKIAHNADVPHPMSTSPNGIRAMVAELKDRGAGRVIVADQSGVETVRLTPDGLTGSTRENTRTTGMLAAIEESGAEAHFFEEDVTFEDGYFVATLPAPNNWPRGMYLANIIKDADHIINMPRIGAHILAGLTMAHKSAIGWLRDDSRHDLHNDAENFYAKYAEVNYAKEITDRLRMTVTFAEKLLLHSGPDSGTVHNVDPRIVIASENIANHDALATSILVYFNNTVDLPPGGDQYQPAIGPNFNRGFANSSPAGPVWDYSTPQTDYEAHTFEQSILGEAAIQRAWELTSTPVKIGLHLRGTPPADDVQRAIIAHGAGKYEMIPALGGGLPG